MQCNYSIVIKGVVQGVGFRPFVYRLAYKYGLKGWVLNSNEGLKVEVEGDEKRIFSFISDLKQNRPPISIVESIDVKKARLHRYREFSIRKSIGKGRNITLISPDISTCDQCLKDVMNKNNRRHNYPFTNCTDCGPRFSIIKNTPYDREKTTMKHFVMCSECKDEYENPLNRRFHAQPNACNVCGPQLALFKNGKSEKVKEVISTTVRRLSSGGIVAIKGLGGFHIAVDASNEKKVKELRKRKNRPHKPFAVMMSNIKTVEKYCVITDKEKDILKSPRSPVVLLRKKKGSKIARSVAPSNPYLGVMLPYTPLHHLLFKRGKFDALVMTSGNRKDEPLVGEIEEAADNLIGIADYFLSHNRGIKNRNDDSVVFYSKDSPTIIRRSRGYAPYPILLDRKLEPTLGVGSELKNTFCLAEGEKAFISQHIGDLENLETFEFYKEMINKFKYWFKIEPQIVAYDLHPDYLSTRFAKELTGVKLIGVQHHCAHIASCMAENRIKKKVIGLSFDGTGYGTDGRIWGCEFLVGDYNGFERKGRLRYLPLPGGEVAIKKPYRIGIAYVLYLLGKDRLKNELFKGIDSREIEVIKKQIDRDINLTWTSSLGRLFDAVSGILRVCSSITFEAQAAMALEYEAKDTILSPYDYEIVEKNGCFIIEPTKIIEGILYDYLHNINRSEISTRFHSTIIKFSKDICLRIRRETGIDKVVLSGGVFQNRLFLGGMIDELSNAKFEVFTQRLVPPNDGGISLGQVMIANARLH